MNSFKLTKAGYQYPAKVFLTLLVLSVLYWLFFVNAPNPQEAYGRAIGGAIIPLFNGHLVVKYMNAWTRQHELSTLLGVGILSLFTNSILVLLVVLGAIILNKLLHRTKKQEAKVTQ